MTNQKNQYDGQAVIFSEKTEAGQGNSTKALFNHLKSISKAKNILDLGCGTGLDLKKFESKNVALSGIDCSKEMLAIAKTKIPGADLRLESFENTSFADETFDLIFSRYAIQNAPDIKEVYAEVFRILKPGGYFVFLSTHPFRALLEKSSMPRDYFKKELVESRFFENTVCEIMPSHTINEYLNNYFLEKFNLMHYEEHHDPDSEIIENSTYPSFLIIKAQKK